MDDLGATLLGNILRGLTGESAIRAGEKTLTVGGDFLMLPYSLTKFEIQKYYQNDHRFNDVYSRDNKSAVPTRVATAKDGCMQ